MMRRLTSRAEARGAGLLVHDRRCPCRARAGRSARRHSGRGSRRPRPAPRCSRRAARIWCAAGRRRRSRRRRRAAIRRPAARARSISGGMPSTRYSFGMPILQALHAAGDRRLEIRHRADRRRSCPSGRARPSSAAGWRCRAPCGRSGRPGRATRRRRRCPSASSGHRSA